MGYDFRYKAPGPVARDFIRHRPASIGDTLPIDIIRGPIGSGKTTAAIIRILMHAMEQPAAPDGWRRSRWAIVRNTNPMLETTTIQSWLEWFPEEHFGKFSWSTPYSHTITRRSEQIRQSGRAGQRSLLSGNWSGFQRGGDLSAR